LNCLRLGITFYNEFSNLSFDKELKQKYYKDEKNIYHKKNQLFHRSLSWNINPLNFYTPRLRRIPHKGGFKGVQYVISGSDNVCNMSSLSTNNIKVPIKLKQQTIKDHKKKY